MSSRRPPSLWRHHDFLLMWSGQSVSRLGSQVSLLALPLLAIGSLHATTFQVGLLSAAETVPFLLVGLPAGVMVDRVRRRRLMIAADTGRAVVLASVPVAWGAGLLTIGQLFAAAVVSGVLTVFFDVAYQSYLPDLVESSQLVDGNAKLATTESLALVAGPATAGVLVEAIGAAFAVVADSVSFAVSALALVAIHAPDRQSTPRPVTDGSPVKQLLSQIADGLRFVFGERHIRSIAGCTAMYNFFGGMIGAIIVLYMYRSLHLRAGVIGVLFALGSVGAVLGSLIAGRLGLRLGVGSAILWSAAIGNAGDLLLPLARNPHPLPYLVAGLFITGTGAVIYNVNQVSLRQELCPPELLGRMNASVRFVVWGTLPLGGLTGGILGTALGLHATLWIGASGAAAAFLWIVFSPVPRLRASADAMHDVHLGEVSGPTQVEGPVPS